MSGANHSGGPINPQNVTFIVSNQKTRTSKRQIGGLSSQDNAADLPMS